MRIIVALLLASSPLLGQVAQGSPHGIAPATPAGQALSEWLDAFNSGDSTALRAYYDRHELARLLGRQFAQQQQTGGYDLISIEKSTARYIEFVVKARATGIQSVGVIEMHAEGRPGIRHKSPLVAIPPGRTVADFTIDSARRASVIDRALDVLSTEYVFSEVGKEMGAYVRAQVQRGEYDDITNGITLAFRLTEHLMEVSKDKHLTVHFSAAGGPSGPPPGTAATGRSSCGFSVALQPHGNVAVIKFNEFVTLNRCKSEATRALEDVADADALIFDLRENIGGDSRMVAHISSYLFDERTHLSTVMSRRRDGVTKRLIVPDEFFPYPAWTHDVPGRKYGGTKPVYVLTSRFTFSAAEAFTYSLQALKRATIVGEQTGGGAHLWGGRTRIDDQFTIAVPNMYQVNPITNTNWEARGVTPDVAVPAAAALETAITLIAQNARR